MSTPHSLHDEPNKDQNVGKFKKSVLLDIPEFWYISALGRAAGSKDWEVCLISHTFEGISKQKDVWEGWLEEPVLSLSTTFNQLT